MTKGSRLHRVGRVVLALALTLSLLASAGMAAAAPKETKGNEHGQAGAAGSRFEDADEASWAALFMEKMNLKGVVLGQPDGKFQPNAPVTHEQAVTMAVRVMGLEAEAKAKTGATLTFGDKDKISSWALGYVEEAVEKGILSWGENGLFKPNEPTTRLEVAVMLVKALGLTAEAGTQTGTPEFKDKATIPQASIGFILIAADQGLVVGAPDPSGKGYVFQALKPVTRAEMTAFMDREDSALGKLDEREVKGAVVSVATGTEASITITKKDGTQGTYQVAADARIFIEKQAGTLADLKAGDQASLHLDENGVAVFLDIRFLEKVSGTVKAITPSGAPSITVVVKKSGEEETYAIDPNCKVVFENSDTDEDQDEDGTGTTPATATPPPAAPTLADVKVGDPVALELNRLVVTKIEVKELDEVPGEVTAVTAATGSAGASITLKTKEGATFTYGVANEVRVRFEEDEQAANFASIVVGDQVALKFENRLVAEVKIENRKPQVQPSAQTLSGTVKSLDATAQTFVLTVAGAAGSAAVDHSVTTSASTTYTKAGQTAAFADLAVGQTATVTGTATGGGAIAATAVAIQ
ncbi:MAG TPA: S-layer homology domain-containing protein [Bacillota bacterium]|jgi:hypothetical protein